ncbi:MAG: hypothetical protein ATN36_06955 [Epulopiscium sp. Nele67-Bin005]|nr:MAG: hypothetical protein ATN36_06955 [Epulopiscium sp. Nele67-Bin005]
MQELILLFVTISLINSIVITDYLEECPSVRVYKKMEVTIKAGCVISFILIVSSVLFYAMYNFVLMPLNMEFLRIVVLTVLIVWVAQMLELILPSIQFIMKKYMNLLLINCILMGLISMTIQTEGTLIQLVILNISSSMTCSIISMIIVAIAEHFQESNIIAPLRGLPIVFMIAGFISLTLLGFVTVVQL